MKKAILCGGLLLGVVCFTNAQTTGSQSSKNTQQSSGQVKSKAKKKTVSKQQPVSQRQEYKSRKTGQTATPTGQEATGTNGSHSSNPKNAGKSEE